MLTACRGNSARSIKDSGSTPHVVLATSAVDPVFVLGGAACPQIGDGASDLDGRCLVLTTGGGRVQLGGCGCAWCRAGGAHGHARRCVGPREVWSFWIQEQEGPPQTTLAAICTCHPRAGSTGPAAEAAPPVPLVGNVRARQSRCARTPSDPVAVATTTPPPSAIPRRASPTPSTRGRLFPGAVL